MITVFGGGTSRSLRVTWLMEEMGLPYHLRPVNLLSDGEDAEFLAVNPAGFIPAMRDGDVTMVESIAIMEYPMARVTGRDAYKRALERSQGAMGRT